ncbi:iron-containing alcohol dehydrogenase [Shewanella surugensis]|uniref:Iron-containing alcohol dehydrogenase n=1 Tax=Shewanella surugensis TaxID=212020 RepID=A0ABT0LBR0_9GAMM|nr:iron-containing alcohol dehydrogenase [Shewanella surugensis]MCL1124935.1 iron-containing alcohol dehydrogenase [Shewanella surugensis]
MILDAHWHFPTDIRVGAGCLSFIAEYCQALKITKVLLVTDKQLAAFPMVKQVKAICAASNIFCDVFSQVESDPTDNDIALGVDTVNKGSFDGIIALGGGASLDAAKAIALSAKQTLSLWEMEDVEDNWTHIQAEKILPLIAIPTTAGTGSEVGRAAVITDTQGAHHCKRILFHPQLIADRVLLDPLLTIGLPANITAATGMDALSHLLEAYCVAGYHPMAEGIAVEGIKRIKRFLPIVFHQGQNVEARTQMLVASCMGATAFQRGLGAMHALAHPLGALYHKHHGLLNAILMPYVLRLNRTAIEDKMTYLTLCLGFDDPSFEHFLSWILALRKTLGIPQTLAEIGIESHDAKLVGKMAACDSAAAGNPIQLHADQYAALFIDAVKGVAFEGEC